MHLLLWFLMPRLGLSSVQAMSRVSVLTLGSLVNPILGMQLTTVLHINDLVGLRAVLLGSAEGHCDSGA